MSQTQTTKKTTKTKKKKAAKKYYFTKEHEDAVIKYCKTNSVRVRTELYIKYLEPAFDEMVDKIDVDVPVGFTVEAESPLLSKHL